MVHRALALVGLVFSGLILGSTGCGGGFSAGGSVTGTVDGNTLVPNDVISGVHTANGNTTALVLLTTVPEACSALAARERFKGSQGLVLTLAQIDLQTLKSIAPTAPGTFTIWDLTKGAPPSSDIATANWALMDATCATSASTSGASGTVTITAVNGSAYSGSGDVTFATGDHLTFTFDAAACGNVDDVTSGGSTTCM